MKMGRPQIPHHDSNTCENCSKHRFRRYRRERLAAGLCSKAGCQTPHVPARTLCIAHALKQTLLTRAYKQSVLRG